MTEEVFSALPCLTEAARLDSGPDLLSLVAQWQRELWAINRILY